MITNDNLLKLAQSHLGENGRRFQRFAGLSSGQAWCNAFVDYVASEGGVESLYFNGRKYTYCPYSIAWCYRNLANIPIYLAMPMDIVYFDWEANGNPNHIGFARSRKSDQVLLTIEGNTSGGIVAEKTRPLYGKYNGRKVQYIQAVFRPHLVGKYKIAPLEIDGQFGYNSIAMLRHVLGLSASSILDLKTVKTLQKRVGVTQDGSWGNATSKAIQRKLCGFKGTDVDGHFGEKSVKALQEWINAQYEDMLWTVPKKAVRWAKETAADDSWVYVTRSAKKNSTWECPICHNHPKGKTHGWNCIGFVGAAYHHGAGLKKMSCNNDGILSTNFANKMLTSSKSKAATLFADRNGYKWQTIKNSYKPIDESKLEAGDIVICYDKTGRKACYKHVALYIGGGYIVDATSAKGIKKRKYTSLGTKPLLAIRYVG